MKLTLAFFFLLLSVADLTAQHSTVFPSQHNFLIKGIPNRISIGLPGIEADSIQVTASHSKLEKTNNWNWEITPDTAYRTEEIIVTAWNNNKMVSVDTTYFWVTWLPAPKIYVGSNSGVNDSATISELVAQVMVAARGENIDQDVVFKVISYDFRLEPYAPTYQIGSAAITAEIRKAIMNSKKGDRAVFYNIMVKYPDGRIKPAKDVVITIK